MENSRNVSVGDLIYGSDAYYGQVTRIGGSVVEFTTVGLMPAGPQGVQGIQGPIGLTGAQGIQGIPGEVQIKDMPGYNFQTPDLTSKTDLGDGVYRLHDSNGVTIDYNTLNGEHEINGTIPSVVIGFRLTNQLTFEGEYVVQYVYIDGTTSSSGINYYYQSPTEVQYLFISNNKYLNKRSNSIIINGIYDCRIALPPGTYTNFKFKLQLEKGSQATPYTLPGEIPQYNDQFALRQQENWITPTLVNGATGTLQYRKDSLDRVWFKGTVIRTNAGQAVLILPVGYRPGANVRLVCSTDLSGFALLTIVGSGNEIVYLDTPSTTRRTFYLDSISFKAEE